MERGFKDKGKIQEMRGLMYYVNDPADVRLWICVLEGAITSAKLHRVECVILEQEKKELLAHLQKLETQN